MVGGSVASILQTLFIGSLISVTGPKKMGILGATPNKDMAFMMDLIKTGKVTPTIDRRYPLHEAAEALRYLGAGHARGKVVITVVAD
jgi:NADPH:quinone reductase-like Zn-dependent oxidoreductase